MLVTENLCQNTFGWTKTSYNRKKWYDRGYGGFGFFTDYVSGPLFYRNIVSNVGSYGFTLHKEWEDGNQTMIVNNLIVGAPNAISIAGATRDQVSRISVLNNVIVDASTFGFILGRSGYPTPYDKFDFNNNLYYHYGWSGGKWNAGIGVIQDSDNSWQVINTFDDLHKSAPNWETTEYLFDPEYGTYKSCYNLSLDERHFASVFDDGTFNVTSPLIDKGTDSLPKALQDLLKFYKINDVKRGSRYDLGPFEAGVESWIPSSKKEDPISFPSDDDEEIIISSASSFYLSITLLLVCLSLSLIF